MARSRIYFGVLVALLNAGVAFAGIGPVATLEISNANVSPDGFTRAATVTNGQVDGPLITGKKVNFWLINLRAL
jgi:iron transport multicopper oxidase